MANWNEAKFSRLCADILRGLGMEKAQKFTVKGVKQAYRAKLVRESSDGMFRGDDIQLCLFMRPATSLFGREVKPLEQSHVKTIAQAALAAEASQVLLAVFGEVNNEAATDLRELLDKENIALSLLTGVLTEILALDFSMDKALQAKPRPLDFSFAHVRDAARQQVEEAPWRKRFQTVPLQPARLLPLHEEKDALTAEADMFRALRHGSFLLLGEPGAGKTTALLFLAGELAAAGARVPLFVPLGRYQGDFSALLGEQLGANGLSATVTEALLHSGMLTLLLDGINEVQEPELHEKLVADINRYTAPDHLGSHSRWIVSGRVHDYEQSRNSLSCLEKHRWEMQSLSPDLVYRYLADALGEAQAKTLYHDLGRAVGETCANPLLLSMVSEVYQQTGAAPAGRGALYREFIRLLLSWGEERGLGADRRRDLETLLPAANNQNDYIQFVENALAALAVAMPATFIPWEDARRQLIANLPDCADPAKAAALLLDDLIHRGILRQRAYNRLSFYHHTFQEYFLARTLIGEPVDQLIPDQGVPAERREAVVFLAGFMDQPGPLLDRAMQIDLLLAYELLHSLPMQAIERPATALAKKLWPSAWGNRRFAGANRRYAILFQRVATVLNKSPEDLAAELDQELTQEQHIENVMRFYEELGDAQAQQRALAQISQDKQPPQALLFRAANAAYDTGDYERSVKLYSQYLDQHPEHAAALNNRALAYGKWGRKQEARADYERAIELGGSANRHTNFANLLYELGEKDQAMVQVRLALQKDPAHAEAHNSLADWLEKEDAETALKHREQAVRHAPHDDHLRLYCKKLATLQEKLGHHADAIRTLRRLIELDPTSEDLKEWKQRIAHLRQNQDQQERELSDRRRLQESGELPLPRLAAAWLQAAGLKITAATGTELLACGGRHLADPLPVLLLPEAEITPATLREAVQAMPRAARKARQAVLISAADHLSLEARQQLAALQDERAAALITSLEVRDALLQSDRECRQLLDRALRTASQDDPFAYKQKVRESTEFFGRIKELEKLTASISKGQSLGLYGIHKIGKSSLLEQLRRKLHVTHPQITILKLELDGTVENAGELYRRILDKLPGDADLPDDNQVSAHYFRQTLQSFHARREHQRPGHRILLILDEYAYLLPKKHIKNDFISALSLFKVLVQEGWLLFLPCGRTAALNRQGSWDGEENPFVDFLLPLFLGPLPREEHDGLLTSLGTRAGLSFKESAMAPLYAETGGHPGFTRSLGSQLLTDGKKPVTPERVEKAVKHFLADRDKKAILQIIYQDRLDEEEKQLALMLAEQGALPRKALFPKDADTAQRYRIRDALDNLLDTYVLRKLKDGRIDHRYGLLRRVIRQEAEELGL
ncbi:MAG: tetratricopeptide repeat protein [Gammaproteobacteria bacterium]|nr:tetratricopeptide repeat protein [Gammaproteobacteria bacterium]